MKTKTPEGGLFSGKKDNHKNYPILEGEYSSNEESSASSNDKDAEVANEYSAANAFRLDTILFKT